MAIVLRLLVALVVSYLIVVLIMSLFQTRFLFHPTHEQGDGSFERWEDQDGRYIGLCRLPDNAGEAPKRVWLMFHGNGGQAFMRGNVAEIVPVQEALFILEYPGYGDRAGEPTMDSINSAASGAYRLLRARYPEAKFVVIGESIGTGPASLMGTLGEHEAPDHIVLAVPYDTLVSLAKERFPFLPIGTLLRHNWDNVQALSSYSRDVVILAAELDRVIPVHHAKALAEATPGARIVLLPCGHNEWSFHCGPLEKLLEQ